MSSIRKRGEAWFAEVRRQGVHQYASFPTKAEAQEWAAELERKIRQGRHTVAHDRTLGDLLERFAQTRTTKWDKTRLTYLSKHLGAKELSNLTPEVLSAWRDLRLKSVSGSTVARDFGLLSAAFTKAAKEWRWLPSNPLRDVKWPGQNPHRERIATDEEIEKLCYVSGYEVGKKAETLQQRVIAAFIFAIETGCRGGEICRITHADHRNNYVVLWRTKNGERRSVPLSENARRVLADVGGEFGITDWQKDALFRKIRNKAGIVGLNFHDSRHTAITRLAKKLTPLELARMVGHRNLNQLLTYYNESAENIAKRL